MSRSHEPLVGRLLDRRYLIGEHVARGGMASVYAATDTRLDRLVAVKVMHPNLGDDQVFATTFAREARSAAKLNHPNVVSVFDQGEDDGTVYLVMEYVPGRTLRDVIREQAPMPVSRALALLEEVLLALSAAHDARIIHRDMKPENVLIGSDGRVKVADFGLARAVTSATAASTTTAVDGTLVGTVSYLAPELVVNAGADARSDVYACGAMLYEMLTGSKPHTGDSPIQIAYKHVHEDVPAPSLTVAGIPPYVDALVARATARDRDQRSADARVLLRQTRHVRSAVEQGIADDVDLTRDLMPHRVTPPGVPAVPGPGWSSVAPSPAAPESTIVVSDSWTLPPTMTGDETGPTADSWPGWQLSEQEQSGSGDDHDRGDGDGGDDGDPHDSDGSWPAPARSRRGLYILIGVVLLAVLASVGGWYLGEGRFSTTPKLTGMTQQEAQALADRHGLEIDVTDVAYNETAPKDTVIETSPGPGDRILDGGTIELVLSKGKERYAVPRLRGRSAKRARRALDDVNLTVGEVTRRYSERFAEGDVISASRKPKEKVKRGTEVDLVVSRGRRPIEIPAVVGSPLADARAELEGAAFTVNVERSFDDDVPKGEVIAQDPDGGSGFKGDAVTVVVSKGPELVEVPDVFGSGRESAVEELEEAGFDVKVKNDDLFAGLGFVRRQSPSGGELLAPGTTVTIYIF